MGVGESFLGCRTISGQTPWVTLTGKDTFLISFAQNTRKLQKVCLGACPVTGIARRSPTAELPIGQESFGGLLRPSAETQGGGPSSQHKADLT